ncbi:glycerol kinase GlpK [Brevibacillus sp. HB1.2]|uniref:FGGY family carbohydrate kinase n=1 Tax=Brevibacillus TaxID=55080 RepID=UPI0015769CF3|nr:MULTISPECIES: glycerol kinase [unclassified Brevibacillus]NTU23907.1 glycerol kinase GlpK [Brevibacillus sp. HB1.2]NTU32893.1 glycerol kinase GlpK [Brevibacillus sp. HB1.1]
MEKYLLSIDQGTTGTKVLLVNHLGRVAAESYQKHTQYYPQSGWVEHNPEEIWEKVLMGVADVLLKGRIEPEQVEAVGLANQGETVVFWDSVSGEPLYPAVVWSCRRSDQIAERWKADGVWAQKVAEKTGLLIDPYFSATKIRWMMEEVPLVQEKIRQRQAYCSTLDSWLIWQMTGGASYVTDASTAARTLLFAHRQGNWDEEILRYLEIEEDWLPQVRPTVGLFGRTDPVTFCGIQAPILVSQVDQPAALYGHLCIEPGMSKCTYGTGCFAYMNVGNEPPATKESGLLTTLVWKRGAKHTYALDGAIYAAGSAVEWGKEQLGLYQDIDELQRWSEQWYEELHKGEAPTNLLFIPALNGIGTPYWNSEARGVFLGLSQHTDRPLMAKAMLEGIAHRVADVFVTMEQAVAQKISVLRVDGGLTDNPYLMQFQADLLGVPIEVPQINETTAMGIAFLLGEECGWWSVNDLEARMKVGRRYEPQMDEAVRERLRARWNKAIHLLLQVSEG